MSQVLSHSISGNITGVMLEGIYAMREKERAVAPTLSLSLSLFQPFPIHIKLSLFSVSKCVCFILFYFSFFLSFLFDLKGRRESIVMMQQKQRKQHTSIFALSKEEKK